MICCRCYATPLYDMRCSVDAAEDAAADDVTRGDDVERLR